MDKGVVIEHTWPITHRERAQAVWFRPPTESMLLDDAGVQRTFAMLRTALIGLKAAALTAALGILALGVMFA